MTSLVRSMPVGLLGDHDTIAHREDLSTEAIRHGHIVVEAFGFTRGEAAAADELSVVGAAVSAIGWAIQQRMDLWVPFPAADLRREQHARRLSLVLQRHGLNLRGGRELTAYPLDDGLNEIDFALRCEVRAVDALDDAVLAALGADTLAAEIERACADASPEPSVRRPGPATAAGPEDALPPALPAPTDPWPQRRPVLKRYAGWLVHGCGVTQAATARVLNSTGQRTARGRRWQPATVSKLLDGRYDRGGALSR